MSDLSASDLIDPKELEESAQLAIKAAREDLLAFALMIRPNFVVGPHHKVIADHLKMVWNGHIRRLMIFMPPRSGKSEMTSVLFPAWCLGHSPSWHTISVSHSATLAEDWSREVRNIVSTDIYQHIFPQVSLRQDSRAANRWHTTFRGVYTALGVGGHVAGRGAHLALLDDPISEQDAYSKAKRDRVNNWYPGGLRTRLMPGGRVILTMCMVGDTKVSMADGTYKELKDIVPGDMVMAWKNGSLVPRKILNHTCQGLDDVFELKTGNNTVRANARHPFLVRSPRGNYRWVKLGELDNIGKNSCLVVGGENPINETATITEEEAWLLGFMFGDGWVTHGERKFSGERKNVYRYATCWAHGNDPVVESKVYSLFEKLFSVKMRKTTFGYYRTDRKEIGKWLVEHGLVGKAKTKRLPSFIFSEPLNIREAFLNGHNTADGHIRYPGTSREYWCMTISNRDLCEDIRHLARSCGYCPSNICSYSGVGQPPNSPSPIKYTNYSFGWPKNKKDSFHFRRVRSIKSVGKELVYDVEVEDAECFLADGLVSHNTRWSVGDLAGWLLEQQKNNPDADKWTVLTFPALLDEQSAEELEIARERLINQGVISPMYPNMEVGKTYWPVLQGYGDEDEGLRGWKTEELISTRENTPPHEWNALYMQRPSLEEGNIIKSGWWKRWPQAKPPKCRYVFMSMDTAYSEKESADYSAITTWGIFNNENDRNPNLMLLGAQKGRWDFPELRKRTMDLYRFYQPDAILIEKKASGQSLIQDLRSMGVPVLEYNPEKDKVARAYASTPVFHGGRVWAPNNKNWAEDVIYECGVFPSGVSDDYVDTVTQAVLWARQSGWSTPPDEDWLYDDDYGRIREKRKYY